MQTQRSTAVLGHIIVALCKECNNCSDRGRPRCQFFVETMHEYKGNNMYANMGNINVREGSIQKLLVKVLIRSSENFKQA